jgi:hypothetical protein
MEQLVLIGVDADWKGSEPKEICASQAAKNP